MRKIRHIMTGLALAFLVGCGDKQPPSTTTPGSDGSLTGGGLSPISPITPDASASPDFNPNDSFEPGTEDPGSEDPGAEDPGSEDPGTEDPGVEPSAEPSAEPEPSAAPSAEPTPEPTPAVAAPTAVASSAVGLSGFTLTWSGPANAVAYRVYLDGVLEADNVNGSTYAVTDLEQGKTYSVEITALDANDAESAKSTALSVTTTSIAVPADLAQSDLTYDSVKLTWTAASGATSYVVYRGDTKVADNITATTYTMSGLTPETDYEVQVSTKTSAGESAKSTAVSFTTPKQPDPYGNERVGFLNMSALDFPDGLDVRNGHAYVGHFVEGCVVCYNYRYVRDLTIANGTTNDIEISRQGTTKVTGVAVNAAVIWAAVDQFDKDGWNLYKLNISGERINRFKIGTAGEILSDVAVDSASGLVYVASRTHKSIVKFNETSSEATYFFSGATNIDPLGVAVDTAGDVYTFDGISQKVIKFAKADGARLLEFGPKGLNNTGEIYTAVSDVAVDPRNGDIYVTGNAGGTVKIFRYSAQGNFLRSFKDNDLKDPRKLTVDADGKVYVIDYTQKGVMVFSAGETP